MNAIEIKEYCKKIQQHFYRVDKSHLSRKQVPHYYEKLEVYHKLIFKKSFNFVACDSLLECTLKLLNMSNEQITAMIELKSKLKEGRVFEIIQKNEKGEIYNEFYTVNSPHLTAKIVEKIKEKYGLAAFEYYVEQKIEKEKVVKAENIADFVDLPKPDFNEMTMKQLKEIAAENNIKLKSRSKQQMIDEINEKWQ